MLVRDDADEHYYYYYYYHRARHHAAGEARRRGAGCVYIIETYAFPVDRSRSISEPVFRFPLCSTEIMTTTFMHIVEFRVRIVEIFLSFNVLDIFDVFD